MLTLEETIQKHKNLKSFEFESMQMFNWLTMLQTYIKKDTPKEVVKPPEFHHFICPHCEAMMAQGVRNYCDWCGGAVIIPDIIFKALPDGLSRRSQK